MNKKAMTVRDAGSESNPADAHLWVCSGKNVGRRYRVGEGPRILGRALSCDIVVEDERASQRHAQVQFSGGRHLIEDLGSTNGTFVNSRRVQQASLQDGDLVQVGETVFEYLSDEDRTSGRSTRRESVPDSLRSGAQEMLKKVREDQVGMVPAPSHRGQGHSPADMAPVPYPQHPAQGGMYPHQQYGGHYAGYYEEEEEAPDGGGFDLVATLVRARRLLAAYLPYWPLVASFIFIGVALGALFHKYNPLPQSAAFQIVLRTTGTVGNVFGTGSEGEGNVEFFGSEVATRFKSPLVIEHALKRVTGRTPSNQEVAGTSASLNFERIGLFQSDMFGGVITAPDGDYAVRYLNTHLRVFLDREVEMALSQMKADVGFFRAEVEKTAKLLDDAEKAVSEYKATHPDALPEQARSNYNLLFTLQQRRSELERNMVALEASLREDRRQLSQTPKLTKSGESKVNLFPPRIAETEAKIAAARAQGKGDQHPEIIKLKKELAEYQQLALDDNTQSGTTQVAINPTWQTLQQRVQQATARFRAMKQQLRQIDLDLKEQKGKIEVLPKAEAEYQELARVYETTQKEYSALLNRLKNVELHLERERARADSQYQIVVPPRVIPLQPNEGRMLRLILGGVLGAVLALLFATIFAFRSGRLSLSLILGREIDLSALLADDQQPQPQQPPASAIGSDAPPEPKKALNAGSRPASDDDDGDTAIVDTRNAKLD